MKKTTDNIAEYYRGTRKHQELVLAAIQGAIGKSETKSHLIENLRLDM